MNLFRKSLMAMCLLIILLSGCTGGNTGTGKKFTESGDREYSAVDENNIDVDSVKEGELLKTEPDMAGGGTTENMDNPETLKDGTRTVSSTSNGEAIKTTSKGGNAENGLIKTKTAGTTEPIPVVNQEPIKMEESNEATSKNTGSAGLYPSGVHIGKGDGHKGVIEVEVRVSNGRIDGIKVLSHQDTENLAGNVFRVLTKKIISTQELDVDTVSGATGTSRGFIDAVNNSIKK